MSRLLSMLLVVTGLVLVGPPANATVSVTISASRTTLAHGSSVTFSGRAVHAKRGTLVKLQRKAPAGWRTVASKTVSSTRSYRFTVTPPKGYQYYRVLKPRQLGQAAAASRTVNLTVRWRPSLVLGQVSHEVDAADNTVTTTADGNTTGLHAGTGLRLELQQPDGSWAGHGWTTVHDDHTWSDTFTGSHDMRLRYTAPAAGARLAAHSASFVVDGRWTPTITASATMDSLTDDVTVTGSSAGLSEGSTVQREYTKDDSWVAQGDPVPVAADGSFTDSFAVTMHRSYRYTASAEGLRQEASSPPFEFTDAPVARVSLNSTTEVVFPAGATERRLLLHLDQGQDFTLHGNGQYWVTPSVTDPSGALVPGFGPANENVTARAQMSGDYTILLAAGQASSGRRTVEITLSKPLMVRTKLDDPGLDLRGAQPGQVVDLRFSAMARSVISEHSVPHDTEWGYTRGTVHLLAPSGALVPQLGRALRQGANWQLPAATGDYTLRITPGQGKQVDRRDQSVLLGLQTSATLDGAPGHLSLDRPGRVALVRVTVPEDVRLNFSYKTEPQYLHMDTEFFDPDGRRIEAYSASPDVYPTVAGTYTALVSVDDTAEIDIYASTPASYDAEVGSAIPFDQGAAPYRQALVKVPVTAGQLFSFEVLDDAGAWCSTWGGVESGRDLVEWFTAGGHPSVVKVAESGELVFRVTPCTATGTFRLQPTTIVPSTVTGTTTDQSGYTTTTSTATLEATVPGQVMMMEYDGGTTPRNRLDVRATGSTFPADTTFSVSHVEPGWSSSSDFAPGTIDTLGTMTLHNVPGPRYLLVYAGPTATGTVDLELSRLDY